jgi:tetratricopeptide (TPR) repeat protein/serine/threonine protein kinase
VSADPAQVKSIFLEAVAKCAPGEWDAYLNEVCEDNAEVRRRVEVLLRAHLGGDSLFDGPNDGCDSTFDQSASDQTGSQIGPYKLLQVIGKGGMGIVYMAAQETPVARKVALKVIKPGMDSRAVLARFEAERQALAMMDHPSIAKVFDAGTAQGGWPYFVMELVKGVPITQYCDERHLTPRQRLDLFIPVCQAIQHAHQKGIIHRDIKPSNVLVAEYDQQAVAKVIDFGVAKALHQRLTEKTMFTQFGQLVGTIEYMSPEQAKLNQLDIDTRTDIYSLGVLLYELLTGETPLDRRRLRSAAFDEMLRIIREEEPPKPSIRLSSSEGRPSIAVNRGLEPRKLSTLVRGELDWIVMKALEKDRNRRYDTANGLAQDIGRYLCDEPVQACPPTAAYRLRKFTRRHKGALAIAAVAALVMSVAIGSIAGSVGWAMRDRQARQTLLEQEVTRAMDEAASSFEHGRLADAMAAVQRAEGLLASGEENMELAQGLRQWRDDLELVSRLEAIRLDRSEVREGRFDLTRADPAYREAFRQYGLDVEELEPEEAAKQIRASTIKDQLVIALDDWVMSNWTVGRDDWQRLLAIARRADSDPWRDNFREVFGRQDAKALKSMAREQGFLSQPASSALMLQAALVNTDQVSLGIDVLHRAQRRYPDDFWLNQALAIDLMKLKKARPGEALGFLRAALALRPQSPGAHLNLGSALLDQGRNAEAESEFREALRLKPDYTMARTAAGNALYRQGKVDAAVTEYRQAIRMQPDCAEAHSSLGMALRNQGHVTEAGTEYREARRLKPENPLVHYGLGNLFRDEGKLPEAEASYREAIRLMPDLAAAHLGLGGAVQDQGKPAEAVAEYREALRLDPANAEVHNALGAYLCDYEHDFDGAMIEFNEAIRLKPDQAMAHCNLGNALRNKGLLDEAVAEFQEAIRLDPDFATAHNNLGNTYSRQGKVAESVPEYQQALRARPNDAMTRNNLGFALLQMGQLIEAETQLREAVRLKPDYALAHGNLGQTLLQQEKHSEAAAEFREAIRLKPNQPLAYVGLAWLLANSSQDEFRHPAQALEMAKKAVELAPGEGACWNTVGLAFYRVGDWKAAVEALKVSMQRRDGGNGTDYFILAMAHRQLGDRDESRRWYDKAVEWVEKNHETLANDRRQAEEMMRFRKEATQVLEVLE